MKKEKSLPNKYVLDTYVADNFNNLKLPSLLAPVLLLLFIPIFMFIRGGFSAEAYAQIQKDLFLDLNYNLAKFPELQFNLTQFGDVLVFLPFLTIFLIYAPKFWQYLLTSLFFSGIISNILKKIFAVPRPAAIFDDDSFVIIGEKLSGNTSLPSGHSIATFTILTLVFFAFAPKKTRLKWAWFFFILISGLIIISTRVGVGAHYPLDVVFGGIIGSTISLLCVFLTRKFNPWGWIENKKYYPIFIFLLCVWVISLIIKIIAFNLIIFYLSLVSLLITLFIITTIYVKK